MNRNISLKAVRKGIGLFCMMIVLIVSTSVSFAAEPNQSTGITPKLAFTINSNELLLFDIATEINSNEINTKLLKNVPPAININGGTYIPIRAYCDALGYKIESNIAKKSLILSNNGKTLELFNIEKFEDLSNENNYFSLNGTGYTKVRDFVNLDGLQIKWQDNVILIYGLPSSVDGTVNTVSTGGAVNAVSTESAVNEVSTESAVPSKSAIVTTSTAINTSLKNLSEIYSMQGDQVILADQLIKSLKNNAVKPNKNYTAEIKKTYDGNYYRPFINPYVPYTYPQMLTDIEKLKLQYPEYIRTESAGKSVEGRNLITVEFGKGPKHIFILGSHHAREYISTTYIMYFINQTAYSAKTGIKNSNFDVENILNNVTFHIMPMVNPDGVNLVQNGIESVSPAFREKVRAMPVVGTQYGYQGWKSNINGVDINRNYPTNWASYKTKHNNASSAYPGPSPASEPETKAVMNYLGMYQAPVIVSMHTQGKLIYWSNPTGGLGEMGGKMVASSGFKPILNTLSNAKAGFLSNYAREVRNAYEITVELCKYIGPYPYPDAKFDEVWYPARELLLIVGDEVARN